MTTLTTEQLDDLQVFLKDWLRHSGRTQADLRRALRASSIRMPVLLEELAGVYGRDGLTGLAQRLCEIESLWQGRIRAAKPTIRSQHLLTTPSASWICCSRRFV